MQIHQMNVRYLPEEDRVVLLINTTDKKEFNFLLTRRFVKLILGVLDKQIGKDVEVTPSLSKKAKQAVAQMQHQEAVQQADFSKEYDNAASVHPLGADPLLAHALKTQLQKESLAVTIHTKQGQGVTLSFNTTMLHSLYQILMKVIDQAEWDLAPELSKSAGVVMTTSSKEVH